MIFIAGSLELNGGSTFLIRASKAYAALGKPVAIVVTNSIVNDNVRSELSNYADIYFVHDFFPKPLPSFKNQLSIFMPIATKPINNLIAKYGRHIHAMGIFGLIFSLKLARAVDSITVSVGVYHQHEFMFKSKRLFSKKIQTLFKRMPPSNVIFFNDFNKLTYAIFFNVDYHSAQTLPIGVDLQKNLSITASRTNGRIVSVGNLVGFKTYNEHIIRIVSELKDSYPDLRYDIYGDGPNKEHLVHLISILNVADRVKIHGAITYDKFYEHIKESMLFVGSGTAIIESSSIGLPSIVGIESITTPDTYGFFNQIEDYSYNEYIKGRNLLKFRDLIVTIMTASEAEWKSIGTKCQEKSKDFSIEKTISGLNEVPNRSESNSNKMGLLYEYTLFISFIWVCILDIFTFDTSFKFRRNQLL